MTKLPSVLILFSFIGSTVWAQPASSPTPQPAATETASAPIGTLDNTLSAFGVFSYAYSGNGLGLGARYQKTLVPRGVLRNDQIHDDFAIEGGLDWNHYSFGIAGFDWSYSEFVVLAGAVWNFWLLDGKLALYPKVDFGWAFGSVSTNTGAAASASYGGFVVQGAAGAVYKVSAAIDLRAEIGTRSLRIGAGVTF